MNSGPTSADAAAPISSGNEAGGSSAPKDVDQPPQRHRHRSRRSGGQTRSRFGNSQRTVPAGVAMGHCLLLALAASMVVIGSTGVLEWRDDDFLNLVIGASFLMGMQVMYMVQKYLRWRKKQRDRRTLKAVG